jgi:hypothetical protein
MSSATPSCRCFWCIDVQRYEPGEPALIAQSMRILCPNIRLCIQSVGDEGAREIAGRISGLLSGTGWKQFTSASPVVVFPDGIVIEFGDDITGMGRCFSNSASAARALSRELDLHGIVASVAGCEADDLGPDDVRIVVGRKCS